jgi:hypothetical protein
VFSTIKGNSDMSDKPKCEIDIDGTKRWWLNDLLHREDGPAVEYPNGSKCWYINGLVHREDGPAIESTNGNKTWWLNDKHYTEKEYYKELYYRELISYDDYILEMI